MTKKGTQMRTKILVFIALIISSSHVIAEEVTQSNIGISNIGSKDGQVFYLNLTRPFAIESATATPGYLSCATNTDCTSPDTGAIIGTCGPDGLCVDATGAPIVLSSSTLVSCANNVVYCPTTKSECKDMHVTALVAKTSNRNLAQIVYWHDPATNACTVTSLNFN